MLSAISYFGPVSYYSLLAKEGKVTLEQYERFPKQSYRNRCRIQTANGIMDLSVPVEKPRPGASVKDIQVSSHGQWQDNHWKSLASAYSSSPFFEFYQDDIRPVFEKKWKFLWDLDLETQRLLTELFDLDLIVGFSESWTAEPEGEKDFRDLIHPKKKCIFMRSIPYYQVFEQKFGFQEEMSALDLLFNMGPEAILLLNRQKKELVL